MSWKAAPQGPTAQGSAIWEQGAPRHYGHLNARSASAYRGQQVDGKVEVPMGIPQRSATFQPPATGIPSELMPHMHDSAGFYPTPLHGSPALPGEEGGGHIGLRRAQGRGMAGAGSGGRAWMQLAPIHMMSQPILESGTGQGQGLGGQSLQRKSLMAARTSASSSFAIPSALKSPSLFGAGSWHPPGKAMLQPLRHEPGKAGKAGPVPDPSGLGPANEGLQLGRTAIGLGGRDVQGRTVGKVAQGQQRLPVNAAALNALSQALMDA